MQHCAWACFCSAAHAEQQASAGGAFDPLGLSKDPASYEDLRVKEIKNARLSMVAWVGWAAQAALTRKGPLENLLDFARDPVHENVFAYLSR